jgi:tripartite-type tricarboxylate transporter receptor subunit TctC
MRFLLLAAALVAAGPGFAQADPAAAFPERPVRLVVPYPPAGAADALARVLGKQLSERWGQPVVVDNRPGANGIIGTEAVAKAPGDGYTLLMGALSTHVLNPLLNKVNFDAVKDFAPVTPLATAPWVLVVNNEVPARSVQELLALAKARPGTLNYASYGTGGGNHLAMELLKSMTGADIVHVPYKGSAPAMTDLLGGQVQVMFDSLASALPQVRSGKIRALATTGAERTHNAPDLPTLAESGVPGYQLLAWWALYAGAATPPAVVAKLNRDFGAAMNSEELKGQLAQLGLDPYTTSPEDFARMQAAELAKWSKLVRDAGIKIEQ